MEDLKFKAIAAFALELGGQRFVIGKGNDIPWKQKADMERFKNLTTGGVVVMGRRTYESMGGRRLPKRMNIVLSSTMKPGLQENKVLVCNTKEDVLKHVSVMVQEEPSFAEKLFVIGGGAIYRTFAPETQAVFLTKIYAQTPDPDAFFPHDAFGYHEFPLIFASRVHEPDNENQYPYRYVTLAREGHPGPWEQRVDLSPFRNSITPVTPNSSSLYRPSLQLRFQERMVVDDNGVSKDLQKVLQQFHRSSEGPGGWVDVPIVKQKQ